MNCPAIPPHPSNQTQIENIQLPISVWISIFPACQYDVTFSSQPAGYKGGNNISDLWMRFEFHGPKSFRVSNWAPCILYSWMHFYSLWFEWKTSWLIGMANNGAIHVFPSTIMLPFLCRCKVLFYQRYLRTWVRKIEHCPRGYSSRITAWLFLQACTIEPHSVFLEVFFFSCQWKQDMEEERKCAEVGQFMMDYWFN